MSDTVKLYEKYIEYRLNVDFSRAINDSLYVRAYSSVLCTTIDDGQAMDMNAFIQAFSSVISKLLKNGDIKVENSTILYRPHFHTFIPEYRDVKDKIPTPCYIPLDLI